MSGLGKLLTLFLSLAWLSLATVRAHVVQEVPLHPSPAGGVTISEDADEITVKAERGPVTVSLARIEKPELNTRIYGVLGEVRYSQVAGDGYLEMWSQFPSGRFFSRTLSEAGLMAKLSGDSEWRNFLLPFDRMGTKEVPGTLELNLVLPQGGEVSFRHLVLKEFRVAVSLNDVLEEEGARWMANSRIPGKTGGWIAGALLLALAGFCLMKKPRLARICSLLLTVFGVLILGTGLAAIGQQQSPHEIYALLAAGAGTILFFSLVSWLLRKWERTKKIEDA